jgi:hypothetical protein
MAEVLSIFPASAGELPKTRNFSDKPPTLTNARKQSGQQPEL